MSLLSVGLSGLQSNQTAISVTGNNIANANVEHYSRQRAEIHTRPEEFIGAGYLGSGSIISNIDRVVDQFVINQVRMDTAEMNEVKAYNDLISQLDYLLADKETGVLPGVESFFAALQTSVESPDSVPARQVVISEAEGMVDRFNSLHSRLDAQASAINQQITVVADQVSRLATGIADLNRSIAEAVGAGSGAQPNAMIDDRDELIRQLSELVDIKTLNQDDGSVNIMLGKGQALVVGAQHASIGTMPSTTDPSHLEITFDAGGGPQVISNSINGGQLGGILDYRDTVLSQAYNELGRLALSIAGEFNDQQRQGITLEGVFGNNFFKDINDSDLKSDRVSSDTGNAGNAVLGVAISDPKQLSNSDYKLTINGTSPTSYTLMRTSDNQVVASTANGDAWPPTVDGMTIEVNSGAVAAGDEFDIQPTRYAARQMDTLIESPTELAYAMPLRTDESVTNTGTGRAEANFVESVPAGAPQLDIDFSTLGLLQDGLATVRFTSPTTFEVLDSAGNPIDLDPATAGAQTSWSFTPNANNQLYLNVSDSSGAASSTIQLTLAGNPDAGDTITINGNGNGTSDNRNAVKLAQLRTTDIVGGSATLEEGYGLLVNDIGSKTAQSNVSLQAAEALLVQSENRRQSISGVNLDEEAANLIKFEQAYNASAQIISIARQIFDTLLSSVR